MNPALKKARCPHRRNPAPPVVAELALEKNSLAFGYWTEKHIEHQRKLNLLRLWTRRRIDVKS